MSTYHVAHDPHWEVTEQGWRAVATEGKNGYQAYIEHAESPSWRIWAGYLFKSVEDAQVWCRSEIAHQSKVNEDGTSSDAHWVVGNIESMHNNEFMSW